MLIAVVPIMFTFFVGIVLFIVYAAIMTIISNIMGLSVEVAISTYYLSLIFLVFFSGVCFTTGKDTRTSFWKLIKLCIFPGNSISFSEVLFADALTSLSKVFKDFGVTVIAIYAQYMQVDIVSLHDIGMILVAIFASIPFW
jgi:hypothetical protein